MIAILGGGESGVGAALLAKKRGFDAFVSDYGTIAESYKEELIKAGVDFEEGQHNFDKLKFCSLVVKSPGIPNDVDIVRKLSELGVQVISELEWAYRFARGVVIAITGTNGKTTTTGLCAHILKSSGRDALAVGNIGYSFSRAVAQFNMNYWVCECSSFQLDDIDLFRPDFATVLNITVDHLDRYKSFEDYAKAKWRVVENMRRPGVCLLPKADLPFTPQVECIENLSYNYRNGRLSVGGHEYELSNPYLQGPHNAENASVCIEIAHRLGVSVGDIQKGLDSFVNEAHRMEWIGSWRGKTFINDSKATNLDSAEMALKSYTGSIVWIVGGVDKGNDYESIFELVRSKVVRIIGLGSEMDKIRRMAAKLNIELIETRSISHAVEEAINYKGEAVVLLSPACASFDLFKNYKDRGDQFKKVVLEMINE